MKQLIFLEPVDVWSFRDGKPFDAGESFQAESFFPPAPWTTLGCIRSALLRRICPCPESFAGRGISQDCSECGKQGCQAEPLVGKAGGMAPFRLSSPWPARLSLGTSSFEILLPAPRDLVIEKDAGHIKPAILAPLNLPEGAATSIGSLLPVSKKTSSRFAPFPPGWLTFGQYQKYLAGKTPVVEEKHRKLPWSREPRIGIGVDYSTRAAKGSQIYLRDTTRLEEGWGLALFSDQPLALDGEIGRLGGDGRMARLSSCVAPALPASPNNFPGNRFKLALLSPVAFNQGWLPEWMDPSTLRGTVPDTSIVVRLEAALTEDAPPLGGWDLKLQEPRLTRRMVGAGSVFYFVVEEGDACQAADRLHGISVADDEEMRRAGFGLVMAGVRL